MSMRISFLVLYAVFVGLPNGQTAFAEFECRSQIHYKWKQEKAEVENDVFWLGVGSRSPTEPEAKASVEGKLGLEQKKALAECQRIHQNLAHCIATKFEVLTSVLKNLPFGSRKSLEDSIKADCEAVQGVCLGAKVSEVKCEEKVDPAAQASPGAEGGGEEKEKGKDKDKKKK